MKYFKMFGIFLFLVLLTRDMYALESGFRIGAGGAYGLQKVEGSKTEDSTGLISFLGRSFMSNNRILLQGGGDFTFSTDRKKDQVNANFILSNTHLKLGSNIFSESFPLFVSIAYSWDWFFSGINPSKSSALKTETHLVGLDLQGFLGGNNRMKYEYGLGYYYVLSGATYSSTSAKTTVVNYSSAIKASLGFSYQITQHLSYFMNIKAQYYDLLAKQEVRFPVRNLSGIVELGLQF